MKALAKLSLWQWDGLLWWSRTATAGSRLRFPVS